MSSTTIGVIGIICMIMLFMTRMPVAYVMAMTGVLGFAVVGSLHGGLNLFAQDFYSVFSSYSLTTIPLFILMGQIAFNSGISSKLYSSAYKFFGHTKGGLSIATITACTAFGSVCGSSAATAATMATVGLPEMRRFGYSDALAAGSVASGGGLGMIMPPSVVLIIYGVLTEQSIGKLFMAGILPAILVTILFVCTVIIWCRFSPDDGPCGESFTWREKLKSLNGIGETVLVFILVIGSIFLGICTAEEAASIGVIGVIAVSVIRKQLSWASFVDALYETLKTSCMIMMLVAGATVFGKFLAVTRIPFEMADWISGFHMPHVVILFFVILVYFVGGCFMDSLALVMLTVPVFFPMIMAMGYDPIWFGIIIVMVTEMGVITPPVGLNVYVVYGVARGLTGKPMTLESIFMGIAPFMGAVFIGTIILIIFPQIVLILPQLMH